MKNSLNKLVVLLLAALAGVACTGHTEYDDTGFSAVEKLLYPTTGDAVALLEQADANTYFEWSVSTVGTPAYTVVFMDADKNEIGRYLSDNNGQKASLKMLHSQLNTVAAEAGIAPEETGDLYWTVCAGLGNAELMSPTAPHKLTVTRYASIATPYNLYVTGEGSEFGDDPAVAQKMRDLGDGKFQVYTKFSGLFSFINRNSTGNKRVFGVSEEGRITEAGDATGSAEGVYCVTLDFKRGTVKMEKIESVKYFWCWTPNPADLAYSGNGTWRIKMTVPTGDSRYRFQAMVDGKEEIWGYDSAGHDPDPTTLEGKDYYITRRVRSSIGQWDYAFKFIGALKGVECTLVVDMSPENKVYNQWFEFDFNPEAAPVTLTSPASGASIELNAVAGAKATFSWNKLSDSDPAGKLTTYTVVFFDASDKEVATKDAGNNGSIDVTFADMEEIAKTAGVAAEGKGEVRWAVRSKLLNSTALSDVRKLSVTRMKGLPQAIYISGAASEYGVAGKEFKSLGAGKFEIYTKLTNGAYKLTDGMSGSFRTYGISGSNISEGTSSTTISSNKEAAYRITLDFATATATFEEITDVTYNFKMSGHSVTLDYKGDGIWGKNNFDATNGGNDTRYYLYMSYNGVKKRLGNKVADYSGSDPADFSPEGDSKFFVYLMDKEPSDEWSYYFKFPSSYRNTHNTISLKINMSSSAANYYNYVTAATIF